MTRTRVVPSIAALFVVAVLSGRASARLADGALDPDFGDAGTVHSALSEGRAVAIQPSGKIVVAGTAGHDRFGVARFAPDGTLDPSFGGGDGESVIWFAHPPNGCFGGFDDVLIQPDAKIVAVGAACGEVGVARFLPDGTLDRGFGRGGTVLTPVSKRGDGAEANAVTLQPDGKIVVAGAQPGPESDPAIIRYNPDGTLDATFHGDGTLVSNVPGSGYATDVAVDAERRIWIAGVESGAVPSVEPSPMVARYLPRGRLDPSFGGNGVVQLPTNTLGVHTSLALDSQGRAVVAATIVKDFMVARVHTNGALDPRFSDDGVVTTSLTPGCCDRPLDLVIQPDGKIVVVAEGTTGHDLQDLLALARYTPKGKLDGSFGDHGKVRTMFDDPDARIFSGGLAVAPNGDLIATGASSEQGNEVLLMARYVSRS
ncbi:MAG: hypothetical protein M3O88_03615 [Actinomycetota bacterium]|nr:hypothetical protein [Actinomycetota bacterium]